MRVYKSLITSVFIFTSILPQNITYAKEQPQTIIDLTSDEITSAKEGKLIYAYNKRLKEWSTYSEYTVIHVPIDIGNKRYLYINKESLEIVDDNYICLDKSIFGDITSTKNRAKIREILNDLEGYQFAIVKRDDLYQIVYSNDSYTYYYFDGKSASFDSTWISLPNDDFKKYITMLINNESVLFIEPFYDDYQAGCKLHPEINVIKVDLDSLSDDSNVYISRNNDILESVFDLSTFLANSDFSFSTIEFMNGVPVAGYPSTTSPILSSTNSTIIENGTSDIPSLDSNIKTEIVNSKHKMQEKKSRQSNIFLIITIVATLLSILMLWLIIIQLIK